MHTHTHTHTCTHTRESIEAKTHTYDVQMYEWSYERTWTHSNTQAYLKAMVFVKNNTAPLSHFPPCLAMHIS